MRFASLFSKEEPGVAVSAAAHVAMLAAGLIAFSNAPKPFANAEEAIAVEVVDPSALNEITRGERQAERVQETPRPRAERQSEVAEQRNPGEQPRDVPAPPTRPPEARIAEQAEEAAPPPPAPPTRPTPRPQPAPPPAPAPAAQSEPPRPEPRPREAAAPEPKPELRREQLAALAEQAELQAQRERAAQRAEEEARAARQRAAEAEARSRQQREARERAEADARERAQAQSAERARAEAEARERAQAQAAQRERAEAEARARAEQAARQRAAAEAKARAEAEARARREAEQAARFNAGDISRLLQSREPAQAAGSTGREVNRVASLGAPNATAQRMNPAMMGEIRDLLQRRIEECYSPPPGAVGRQVVNPFVSVQLAADGTLSAQPRISRAGPSPLDQAIAGAALRAVQRCAPFRIPAKFAPFYAEWKSLSVEFVPPES